MTVAVIPIRLWYKKRVVNMIRTVADRVKYWRRIIGTESILLWTACIIVAESKVAKLAISLEIERRSIAIGILRITILYAPLLSLHVK